MKVSEQSAQIKHITPIELCKEAAQECYGVYSKTEPLQWVMTHSKRHRNILEFCDMTVKVKTSIAIARELMRHRIASYMQQSTRFISLTDPSKHEVVLHKDVTFDALFIGSCERAFSDYTTAIDLGKPKEIARDLLPLACATSLYMKTNLSSWKHIIDLRFHGTTGKPHPMISELMGKILEKLREDHSKIATILEGK